ncbi:hypothetical protein GN330_13035 [Nitratireductor sp. CAU 1489]|uniref:THAP4-like heme-binding beta-barrel domain-containing protein n=1 Tax=Nitratireductor arenosus TaxID=2682096 RepID=A0A844QJD9_9HYPH|nr:hypothetical protein [Nitratireductor arenosus]MVA98168.1 hypothetical protein [Nitratireductor arenosus]
MRGLCLVAGAVALFLPAAAVASPLDTLIGVWRGKGMVRERPGAALERAACRLTARSLDAMRISVTGRCGTAGGTARFSVALRKRAGGRIDAVVSSPSLPGDINYAGTVSGSRLILGATAPLDIDGVHYASRVVFAFADTDRFVMVETATRAADGEKQIFFDMSYRREGEARP